MNYKTLLTEIGQIAMNHNQIRSFGYGLLSQLTMDIDSDVEPEYVRMYIVPGNSIINQGTIQYEFSIIFCDRLETDLSNQLDVLNNTLEIAKDIFTILKNSYTDEFGDFTLYYEPEFGANIVPFLERFETILAGWTLNITITQQLDLNACLVPTDTLSLPTGYTINSNYKQIVTDLKNIGEQHLQINSTAFGDEPQLTVDNETKEAPLYTKLQIIPDVTTLSNGEINYNFSFRLVDRLELDYSNQRDLMSNTLDVVKDIVAILYNSYYSADIPITAVPLLDNYEDVLGGWSFDITINKNYEYDRCEVPVERFDKKKWYEIDEIWNQISKFWNNI